MLDTCSAYLLYEGSYRSLVWPIARKHGILVYAVPEVQEGQFHACRSYSIYAVAIGICTCYRIYVRKSMKTLGCWAKMLPITNRTLFAMVSTEWTRSVESCVLRVGGGRSGGGPAHDWCPVILIMLYTIRIAGGPFHASRLCQIHAIPIGSPCYRYAVPIGYMQLLLHLCSFYKINAYHLASMIVTLVTCNTYLLYAVHIDYLLGLLQASMVFWIHAVPEVH